RTAAATSAGSRAADTRRAAASRTTPARTAPARRATTGRTTAAERPAAPATAEQAIIANEGRRTSGGPRSRPRPDLRPANRLDAHRCAESAAEYAKPPPRVRAGRPVKRRESWLYTLSDFKATQRGSCA